MIFARPDFVNVHGESVESLSSGFLHEAEVEANQKQTEMDKATNAQKARGHRSKSKGDKYQLAPAVTKNAPDRNLKMSLQMFFIQAHSKHSYNKLVLTRNSFTASCEWL